MKAMVEKLKRFESVNRTIKEMETVEIPFNFGGPTAHG
jgi:hypothetical protein